MNGKTFLVRAVTLLIALLLSLPLRAAAQEAEGGGAQKLSKEELAQMLAPIALYPDDLVAQILMASTYPLEVVEADRWVKKNKQSAGEELATALEQQNWDPSVKSLVSFPVVLSAMSEKLDITTKIGDAFLNQQKDVMDTIQDLRRKAQEAGNLKSTKEQKVVVEKETIIIKPASPEVVYVPTYSPTVVYGTWAYPAYPPYAYYPPPPPAYPAFTFAAGVAMGAAWGYAWGHADWHGGDVNINHNQNVNFNNKIDRSKYQAEYQKRQAAKGSNTWQHNPSHRKGVAYKDGATAKKYGQSPARSRAATSEARGYGGARNAPTRAAPSSRAANRPAAPSDRGGARRTPSGAAGSGRTAASARSGGETAFSGGYGSRRQERVASDRGQASRQSSLRSAAPSRSGGFGGGSRGGGGGRRR